LLPILGVAGAHDDAERYAADLGIAFQLTNFIRDLGEDYRLGRIYLPEESLIAHGVKDEMLSEPTACTEVRSLVAAEIDRTRTFYQRAEPGIALLAKTARDCVRTAYTLYGDILSEVERCDYDVLRKRAVVPIHRRARVGAAGYLHAVRARRS
jgi:phytoene synthase